MKIYAVKKVLSILLALIVIQGIISCDSDQKQKQGFIQHFGKLEENRMNAANSEKLIKTLTTNGNFYFSDVAWCGDTNTFISSGGADAAVLIWDIKSGKVLRRLDRITGSRTIACSKNGRFIASGDRGADKTNTIRIWEQSNLSNAKSIRKPYKSIKDNENYFAKFISFNSNNNRLYIHYASRKHTHRLVSYEVSSWKIVNSFELPSNMHTKPILSDNSRLYAYGQNSKHVSVINPKNGVEKIRIRTENLRPQFLAFGRDNKTIIIAGL